MEELKFVVDCSKIFLPRNYLSSVVVFSLADVSGLPLKRSLAERLGKKIEVDRAPRRGKRASGFAAQIALGFLLVLSWECCLCTLPEVFITGVYSYFFLPCFET